MSSLLSISGLCVRYGRTRILDGVSLAFGTGVYGIYGANGSGKSTLLRTVAGIQSPHDGAIAIAGADLVSEPLRAKKELGYLAEQFALYPYLSCQELYDTVAVLRGVPEESSSLPDKLAALGMAGTADKRLSALSAGQQRKLCLLVAICGAPSVLLLDEPTKALDVQARAFLSETIASWREERLVVIASHLVELLEAHCDAYALMAGGKCIAEGTLSELRARASLSEDAPLDEVYQALL